MNKNFGTTNPNVHRVLIKHPHKFIIILHALDYIVANVAKPNSVFVVTQ
ncbi:hypothetical protein [uncultured Gammaproteobacteria bacterium]|nr:hypothetical protein [uncultured Gammaproteobacteria bacterium]CAC9537671.1 hypothetical protein [uncultured Gammaproteobacteria bacterium]CAC9542744.1 hypothetical protein [uncultured Gammaproteobacteria bacterium]VVH57023.1 hypothetical protein BAZOLSSOX_3300 [uncultured Gammaproteobacteria bacterium]VVH58496.1 hypothetical protein BAZOLSSOX_38 [uncultured Gammaproteobacteria bacterium]